VLQPGAWPAELNAVGVGLKNQGKEPRTVKTDAWGYRTRTVWEPGWSQDGENEEAGQAGEAREAGPHRPLATGQGGQGRGQCN
jgi:hypothetical protein